MTFPKWMYHPAIEAKIVHTADELAALGKEWADTPAAFAKAVDAEAEHVVQAVENTLADACEAVATEAETVAKRVRKPKKTAETPAN